MNLSVNGQSQVPPGFRFHPTEEELLQYYLKKKVGNEKIDLDVIQEIDLNKLEPWDIQEKCRIGSAPQNDWYFFSHKDKKYPTGTRTNRATAAGFWKATGRDKVICSSSRRIGMRKTLVFYKGRAPHGEKSDWIMHEYRLDDNALDHHNVSDLDGDQSAAAEEGWVVCRVFKKKNYIKASDSPTTRASTASIDRRQAQIFRSTTPDLDHILSYMENSSKEKNQTDSTGMDQVVQDRFMHLPQLNSPADGQLRQVATEPLPLVANWGELDRLVAYQLNGHAANDSNNDTTMPFWLAGDPDGSANHLRPCQPPRVHDGETAEDQLIWSFTKQSYSPTALNWNQTQLL